MKSYDETIETLNNLMKSPEMIERMRKEKAYDGERKLRNAVKFLRKNGYELDDLNSLKAIHVTGTKGKGSTCAFVESILRKCGYRTGLFTSPHLVTVRERIRINGLPLSETQLITYFWDVYNRVMANIKDENDYPAFFTFLTIMAFDVFIKEKVDVAVIEVGIGGEYDVTNIMTKPVVVGITSLGYDHMQILGSTIESIAWHKSGIFKAGVPAFTVPQSYENAMNVLKNRAEEKKCPLFVCPPLTEYKTENNTPLVLSVDGKVQHLNASLALQLCNVWIQKDLCIMNGIAHSSNTLHAKAFEVNNRQLKGLRECKWPGRCQMLIKDRIYYFLDGAHTKESIRHCIDWFMHSSQKFSIDKKVCRVLIFNCTGQRDVHSLLEPLLDGNFDLALFTTNNVNIQESKSCEMTNFNVDQSKIMINVDNNSDSWRILMLERKKSHSCIVKKFACISEVINWLNDKSEEKPASFANADCIHLLATGSFHLIGGVLSVIDPELKASMA
ncbi:folylpolyglutamate synthase-like protein [Dinothrombium tinctorium]|uniref:Folylpolyglutamate synthase n=1 Tax=Dinothrombium tinctorium TaxID=1965070 RepID=A0A3S3P9G4_9ACAR|nr:folylpolyglutamate synthase-like protein [Dinothrombium tinctorium]